VLLHYCKVSVLPSIPHLENRPILLTSPSQPRMYSLAAQSSSIYFAYQHNVSLSQVVLKKTTELTFAFHEDARFSTYAMCKSIPILSTLATTSTGVSSVVKDRKSHASMFMETITYCCRVSKSLPRWILLLMLMNAVLKRISDPQAVPAKRLHLSNTFLYGHSRDAFECIAST